MSSAVAFEYLAHLLTVPVRVGDVDARFIFDTGIGLNLISGALAARTGCEPDGSAFTGRRMSGHPVTIPMGIIGSLQLGTHRAEDVPAGIFDMQAMAGLDRVEGFLSLGYFRATPVTVDYAAGLVVIEDQASLARRAEAGTSVPMRVVQDGQATDLRLGLTLPGGQPITVEVDTGSDTLILNETLAADAGIDLHDPGTRQAEGTDETGHEFVRYFATLPGDVSVTGAPQIRAASPGVMFQKIIYDGLVGQAFLRNFTTTYDLAGARIIFAVP
jgi:Aspartyl protease